MFKKIIFEEKGQSMVLFALSVFVLIGFAGLAIDSGRLYLAKSQLQKAVDAGALAGAKALISDSIPETDFDYTAAETYAKNISEQNYDDNDSGVNKITYNATISPHGLKQFDKFVEVTGTETVNLMLMKLFISEDKIVEAKAKVKIGVPYKVDPGSIIPIGIQLLKPFKPGDVWDLVSNPSEAVNGFFGYLNFSTIDPNPTNNGSSVGDYIKNGSPAPIYVGQTGINALSGGKVGTIKDAINERLTKNGDIVYVPIVEYQTSTNPSGKTQIDDKEVKILGFAVFRLITYEHNGNVHTIKAEFITEIIPGGEDDPTKNPGDYGTYTTELVR